jgi:hypothetical protein
MKALIILIVIEIILIFLVLISVNSYRNRFKISSGNIKDIEFKNCDLLSVCLPNINGKLVQLFTGSRITHLGMIVLIEFKPHVLEVGYYHNYRGSRILPLNVWLSKYSDFELQYLKLKSSNPSTENIEKVYNMLTPCDIDMNVISWMKTLTKVKYNKLCIKNSYYCTEFIVMILQELGIMKKKYKSYCYTPRSLINLQREIEGKYENVITIDFS